MILNNLDRIRHFMAPLNRRPWASGVSPETGSTKRLARMDAEGTCRSAVMCLAVILQ
ncbi:hypothetical protein GSH06_28130 [Burkholderia pseudomallei]|nr:hypothetical protein [Burkholderia pseudomallei]